jgi:zinc protease
VDKRLAAQTFAGVWSQAEPGPLFAGAALAPGQDMAAARQAATAVLDGLASEPVTAEELERARTAWLNSWDLGFTDPERIGVALSEAIALGDWRLYFLARDRVRQVTLADINRVAGQWIRPDNRSVGLYLPTAKPERAPQAQPVDVAAAVAGYRGDAAVATVPPFDPSPANLDARTQRTRLASGLKVALLPKPTRGQVVRARLVLRFGDERTLAGSETVAAFVGSLMDKGGAGLTRQQIADRFDQLQADVGFGAEGQLLTVSITTKRARLPEVVALVGKLLREPAFPADALDEARRQWLTAIERRRKEPEALLENRIGRHGNPYPRGDLRHVGNFDEDEADVKAVTREQLQAFHRRFVSAGSGEFAAVGDFDVAALRGALDAAFGSWRLPAMGSQPFVRVPQPLLKVPPTRFVERTPDKANAHLMAQLRLPLNDRHADYPAMVLANFAFGQGGSSRLWKRIRETEGLSYDVRAVLDWATVDEHTPWTVTAIFAPANRARVEKAFEEELARSLQAGFTSVELEEARKSVLALRRLSRAQDGVLVGSQINNLFLDRRFALSQQIDDAMAKVTLEQLNAVWRRHIDPQRLVTGWAGDFKDAP